MPPLAVPAAAFYIRVPFTVLFYIRILGTAFQKRNSAGPFNCPYLGRRFPSFPRKRESRAFRLGLLS